MAFIHKMIETQKELTKLGHEVNIPFGTEPHQKDPSFVECLEANITFCIENDVMRENFREVVRHDAVLVLNHKRNDIDGYIGVSALMEMAIAHHTGKKIFLLNPPPDYHNVRWAHEVAIMQPEIIHGDVTRIQ